MSNHHTSSTGSQADAPAGSANHDRTGMVTKRITIIWFRRVPYTVDVPRCRKALVRRQVEGELTNMTSLAVAARVSRSTASRFFSSRSTSLAATLRILRVLHLDFGDVCQEATDDEVVEWRRQEAVRKRQDEEKRLERAKKKLIVR